MQTATWGAAITQVEQLWSPSEKTGFLPNEVPDSPAVLANSESPSLRLLGEISPRVGLLSDAEITEFVESLSPEIGIFPSELRPTECEAITRAYVNIAAHLIHRPKFSPRKELPPSIAQPLWAFSKYVGRPPSLTYASYVLANFMSPVSHRAPANGLEIAQTPSGTPDEEWFVAVHLAVESAGGEVVRTIGQIEKALEEDDQPVLLAAMTTLESVMEFAKETMPTVQERLEPAVFRDRIRPLLYGHDQIVFRGVQDDPTVTYIGETGAQSGIIRAVDAVLGTEHSEEMVASMNRFLACAPPVHQRYFAYAAGVGRRLARAEINGQIRDSRRAALTALAEFRRTHLNVVSSYLLPEGKVLSDRGTGGTEFQVWLQRLIDETDACAASA